jgi:hypothetical protein
MLSLPLIVVAQPQTKLTGMPLLFQQGEGLLQLDTLCDSVECHNAIAAISSDLKDGEFKHRAGNLTGGMKHEWHNQFGADLLELQTQLAAVANRHGAGLPIRYKEELPAKPCLRNAYYTCDNVFNISMALCAAYAGVSPPAGAICAVAAVYGYSKCLDQNGG